MVGNLSKHPQILSFRDGHLMSYTVIYIYIYLYIYIYILYKTLSIPVGGWRSPWVLILGVGWNCKATQMVGILYCTQEMITKAFFRANSNFNSARLQNSSKVKNSMISLIDRPHRVPCNPGATKEAEVPAEQNNKGPGERGDCFLYSNPNPG